MYCNASSVKCEVCRLFAVQAVQTSVFDGGAGEGMPNAEGAGLMIQLV